MVFVPAQCSEREPGGWEDCAWCSGVMLNNLGHGANVSPSTRNEYQALRVAGGDGPAEKPGDGSNMAQVQLGIHNRYHWTPLRLGGVAWSVVAAHLSQPGAGAVLTGSMGVFPSGGVLRRWDRPFHGPHAVFVERRDALAHLWWMNPQAPNSYPGQWVSTANVARFYRGFPAGSLIAHAGHITK